MSIERITLTQTMDGEVYQNVFHMDNPDGLTNPSDIADDIVTHWIPAIRPYQTNILQYVNIEVRRVSPAGAAPYNRPLAIFGGSGFRPPHVVAGAVFQFHSATAGRHGRGRYYMAATNSTWYNIGFLSPQGVTESTVVTAAWKGRYVDAGHPSTLSLKVVSKADPSFNVTVTDIVCRTLWGIQRRRNYTVGI